MIKTQTKNGRSSGRFLMFCLYNFRTFVFSGAAPRHPCIPRAPSSLRFPGLQPGAAAPLDIIEDKGEARGLGNRRAAGVPRKRVCRVFGGSRRGLPRQTRSRGVLPRHLNSQLFILNSKFYIITALRICISSPNTQVSAFSVLRYMSRRSIYHRIRYTLRQVRSCALRNRRDT